MTASAAAAVKPTLWHDLEVPEEGVLSPEAFAEAMQEIGRERYHSLHPFHKLLHGGELDHGKGDFDDRPQRSAPNRIPTGSRAPQSGSSQPFPAARIPARPSQSGRSAPVSQQ